MQQPCTTPLCVDLDGTLVQTNTLFEAFLAVIKKNPLRLFSIAYALFQGKAYVKHRIGEYAKQESFTWPYNQKLLAFLQQEHANGRTLVLATASDIVLAHKVAEDIGIFSDVIASTLVQPIGASSKHLILEKRFGKNGFSYAGNSNSDISVWDSAASAIIVHTSETVASAVRKNTPVEAEFPSGTKLQPKDVLQEIRVHQWLKNLLLFIPPLMAHRIGNLEIFSHALIGFFSFSFLASAMYVMNDLLDISADRAHPTKKTRPIARGAISALLAIVIAGVFGAGSFLLAQLFLPATFTSMLVVYIAINTLYSFRIKKIPYVDISILTSLYVLRIIAGSAATGIATSSWLFFFAGCFFFSLASMKRVIELLQLKAKKQQAAGRGYRKQDTKTLVALGTTSSLLSCVVLGLYIRSENVTHLYTRPEVLWGIIPLLLLWTARMWRLTIRKQMHDDPVFFTSKDMTSYLIAAAVLFVFILAGVK